MLDYWPYMFEDVQTAKRILASDSAKKQNNLAEK